MKPRSEMRDEVFICSSAADDPWRERLRVMLHPQVRRGAVRVWDRASIPAGSRWEEEIRRALGRARVAVLLVSADFLAAEELTEVPVLLRAAEAGEVRLLWVPVRASLHDRSELAPYQPAHPPDRPLAGLSEAEQDEALVRICEQILRASGERPRGRRAVWGVGVLVLCVVGLCWGLWCQVSGPGIAPSGPAHPDAAAAQSHQGRAADREQHIKGNLTVKGRGNAAQDVEVRPGEAVRQTVEGDVVIDGTSSSGQRVRVREGRSR